MVFQADGRFGLLKKTFGTCFQSRADCPPSESQGQPIFTLWGAMDRPQTLLRVSGDAVEKHGKVMEGLQTVCKVFPSCHWQKKEELKLCGPVLPFCRYDFQFCFFFQDHFGRSFWGFFLWHWGEDVLLLFFIPVCAPSSLACAACTASDYSGQKLGLELLSITDLLHLKPK